RLCDRQEDSIRHFETAIRLGRRMGARPIVARAQCLLAGVRLSSSPGAEERDELATRPAEAAEGGREPRAAGRTARGHLSHAARRMTNGPPTRFTVTATSGRCASPAAISG